MKEKENNKIKISLMQWIFGGAFLTNQKFIKQLAPFFLMLFFMSVIYIKNRYDAEKILRETINISAEIKELRAESISITFDLMSISKQSEVAKLAKKYDLGLKEAVEPPHKLIIKNDE